MSLITGAILTKFEMGLSPCIGRVLFKKCEVLKVDYMLQKKKYCHTHPSKHTQHMNSFDKISFVSSPDYPIKQV